MELARGAGIVAVGSLQLERGGCLWLTALVEEDIFAISFQMFITMG